MTTTPVNGRPAVGVPPLREPTPEDAARSRRALALVQNAELGVLTCAAAGDELVAAVDRIVAKRLGDLFRDLGLDPQAGSVFKAAVEIRAAVRAILPVASGPFVICRRCAQVGEALEIRNRRVVWTWPGLDVRGVTVHPNRITQARDLGDMPPNLCPDHEAEALRTGEVRKPLGRLLELARGRVQP